MTIVEHFMQGEASLLSTALFSLGVLGLCSVTLLLIVNFLCTIFGIEFLE